MGLLLACPPLPVISNALAYIIKLRILLVLKLHILRPSRKVHLIRVDFNEMPYLLLRTSCSCVPGVLCKWDLLAISVGGTQLASRQQLFLSPRNVHTSSFVTLYLRQAVIYIGNPKIDLPQRRYHDE